jgi:hypothetical protein
MKIDSSPSENFAALLAEYRAGSVSLPSLALKIESLTQLFRESVSDDDFARAMNSVYLIEDINAVALDERRQLTQSENEAIKKELSSLERLLLIA